MAESAGLKSLHYLDRPLNVFTITKYPGNDPEIPTIRTALQAGILSK